MIEGSQSRTPFAVHKGLRLVVSAAVLATLWLRPPHTLVSAPWTAAPPRPTYDSRCEKTASSQIAMDRCIAGEVAQLEREIKVALNDEARKFAKGQVSAVQQDWLRFERAECRLEASGYEGGTIQPLIFGSCERGLLVQRIDEIDAVIHTASQ